MTLVLYQFLSPVALSTTATSTAVFGFVLPAFVFAVIPF